MSLGLGIIGFSLPLHDEYVLQGLYSFARNYTEFGMMKDFHGMKKLPLRLVDLQTTAEGRSAYLDRYRFINWQRAECFFEGFSNDAIDFLFRNPELCRVCGARASRRAQFSP